MISVKFTEESSTCTGKHLIDAYYHFNASSLCDQSPGTLSVKVWVSTSYSTIQQAYNAGATIYSEEDCESCASDGWYSNNPISLNPSVYQWQRSTCNWVGIQSCGAVQESLEYNSNSSRLCDDLGLSVSPWMDDTFANATGLWNDSALTTTWTGPSDTWYKKPGEATIRFWVSSGGNGGTFTQTQLCGPVAATRYQHGVSFSSISAEAACNGSSTTVWADAQNWDDATEIWTSETGSTRPPNGYYVTQLVDLGGTATVYSSTSGQLTNSGVVCDTGGGDPEGPGGFAP